MAKRRTTAGTVQVGLELDAKLVGDVEAFCAARRETKRSVFERALRRHMANPPPLDDPPLPPVSVSSPKRKA